MAIVSLSELKAKFETGDVPTGQDFSDLIDTTAFNASSLGSNTNPVNYVNGIENATVFDTIDTAEWRTIKYMIQLSHNSSSRFSGSEINLVFDGTNVNISEFGTVSNIDGRLGTISTSINNGIISMVITPLVSPINLKFYRTGLKV